MSYNRVEFVDFEGETRVHEFDSFVEAAACFARMDFAGFVDSAKLMAGDEVVDSFDFED